MSVNDDEDPHFRKAHFDPLQCPADCPRPCEKVCPANAIKAERGVVGEKCYGCGRCVPICPLKLIDTSSYVLDPAQVSSLIQEVDCIEIHTQKGHLTHFETLWHQIGEAAAASLKLVAVSFPDMGEETFPNLERMNEIMSSHPKANPFKGLHIWQTDGRPMSGDIGKGTTLASVAFAKKVLDSNSLPFEQAGGGRHFVQLAGGTNAHTGRRLAE
eukprot:CAMPEP_0194663322 /NCGR_PEP_ID=MMETSP0295-20121207/754_1 /TAXON_ID=39354 /ORGANISM="Heterosigma akashiwo, Strain CCMP2393" /LENGTH=213 /DNA_ID=CAMNT_0039544765 /DNA_START=815 /DNA_END=1453 /DNA_ORIENTATION=+